MSVSKVIRLRRTLFVAVALLLALIFMGIIVSMLSNNATYAFATTVCATLAVVLLIVAERRAVIARNAAQSERDMLLVMRKVAESQIQLEKRTKRMERVLNDTAGSVGRSAPVVRRVEASVRGLTTELTKPPLGISSSSRTVAGTVLSSSVEGPRFPNAPVPKPSPTFAGTKVLVIADEFTEQAFAHEWTVVTATPATWQKVIDREAPSMVFIESAWEATGGAWKYHLVGPSAPRPAVVELARYCKGLGVPTVFWNKEDPPHFEDFLDTAKLFDFVFTTDGDKVSEYKRRLGHNRVGTLPFAAQPAIHNPARIGTLDRDRDVVFGGMYFRDKYPERRKQLEILLPAAQKFGLDIFSRNDGVDPKYRFPERYASAVRPGIPYSQMLSAYHAYKVVINVNSVINSSSMCARRVFEATACGAAVVTTPTDAIKRFFGDDTLTLIDDEKTAFDYMRTLLRSDELRERRIHLAQRRIWENDTYTHRAREVMEAVGLEIGPQSDSCSVVVCTNRPDHVGTIAENVARQNIGNLELIVVTHGFTAEPEDFLSCEGSERIAHLALIEADASSTLGANLNRGFEAATGDYVFRMDDDDFYGENYVRDQLNAIKFSGAALVGKAETYIYFEEANATFLTFPGKSHRYTDFVRGATFAGPRKTFAELKFKEQRLGEDSNFIDQVKKAGGKIYSSDRFNYIVNRKGDKSRHTWTVADANLMGTGEMKFVGNDSKQVEI